MSACRHRDGWTALLLVACSTVFGGCLGSTAPSRFYLLTPVEGAAVEAAAAVDSSKSTVFLAAVELPKYLSDPQIVTRIDGNELDFAEFDRWAEPLRDNFVRVLANNLATLNLQTSNKVMLRISEE